LCPIISPLGDYIVPIVGLVDSDGSDVAQVLSNLKRNEDEVESIFWVPLQYIHDVLNSEHDFGQIITPLEIDIFPKSIATKFIRDSLIRSYFQVDESMFSNTIPNSSKMVSPKSPLIYGLNAHIMQHLCLLLIDGSVVKCKLYGLIDNSKSIEYFHYLSLGSYLLFRQNLAAKMKSLKDKSKI
jgi:hypothetical protein